MSQQDMLFKLSEEEIKNAEAYKNSGNESAYMHCQSYNDLLERGIIKEIFYVDGTKAYDLNLAAPYYAEVLNGDGYFAVGDTIFQVTPTKLKIWQGGNINDYKLLNEVENTDQDKNIVVIDYSKKTLPPTRALFPFQHIDQAIGVCRTVDKKRFAITFYDKLVSITPPNSYRRETYIQITSHLLSEGTWNVVTIPYYFYVDFTTLVEGETTLWRVEANNTGGNDWYVVYIPYQAMIASDDVTVTEYTDKYWYITKFIASLDPTPIKVPNQPNIIPRFGMEGERRLPMSGPFYYELPPEQALDSQLSFLTALIPR